MYAPVIIHLSLSAELRPGDNHGHPWSGTLRNTEHAQAAKTDFMSQHAANNRNSHEIVHIRGKKQQKTQKSNKKKALYPMGARQASENGTHILGWFELKINQRLNFLAKY